MLGWELGRGRFFGFSEEVLEATAAVEEFVFDGGDDAWVVEGAAGVVDGG